MKDRVLDSNRINWLIFAKYFLYATIFFVAFQTKIMGKFSPCFYGLFFTFVFLRKNIFSLGLSYMTALVLSNNSTYSIIFGLLCVVFGGVLSIIYDKNKKILKTWQMLLYLLIVGAPYVFLSSGLTNFYISLVNVLLNTIFTFCALNFLRSVFSRNFNLNLNIDETICGMILIAMLFCGLQNINVLSFDIVKMIGLILVLLSSIVLPQGANVVVGVTLGLGAYLCGGNLEYITYFSILSIVSLLFRENRILGLLAILLGDVMLNFFLNLFGNITIFTFMPTIIACAIFAFIPKNMINKIKFNLYVDKSTNSLKTILNQNKLQTSKKLLYTAEIFYEMDKSFRKLVKGTISEKDAKTMLCGELIRTNCESCPNKARCLKGYNNDLRKIFDNLINAGFEKGKITLVDLPQYLTLRCVKLNQLVNSINSLLNDYKSYAKLNLDIDSSKLLVAEQLKGVSHILNELSKETNQVVSQDEKQQILIKENLIYQDIVPSEVICFEKDEKTSIVSLLIRTIDYDNEKILNVINSITNSKMMLDEILPSNDQNMTYVSYKTAPTYDMAIGLAHMTKGGSEKSGDTHSFSRLSSGKFMLALCDGMGSGSKANEKSETSINLIENFYKAGYDDETILSSVNKLLNLTSENVFSALDVSVIDLKNGEADFIKQGATVGFVKTGDKVSKIESSGLPIGILDDVSPKVTKTILSPDDQLIMLSDGVVDAFGEDNLQEFLKYVRIKSPQELADTILNKAKEVQKNYPHDDMTVLVGKLYYNCA